MKRGRAGTNAVGLRAKGKRERGDIPTTGGVVKSTV